MFGDVFLIEKKGGPVTRAERLAFGETAGRDEAWLRDTLLEHPEILPVREIDPAYFPLVPLCRELRTEAGPRLSKTPFKLPYIFLYFGFVRITI